MRALNTKQTQAKAIRVARLRLEDSRVNDTRPLPYLGIILVVVTVPDYQIVTQMITIVLGRDNDLALYRDVVVSDLGKELPLSLLSCLASPHLSLALLSNIIVLS